MLKWHLLALLLSTDAVGQGIPQGTQKTRIAELIAALHKEPWPGATNICSPVCWQFRFTTPMKALLDIGREAQRPLLTHLFDAEIMDQVVILLGGVGDERSVGPIIQAMKLAAAEPSGSRRNRILTAGNLALTNITVSEVIWHHGGGVPIDRCPSEPAACWSKWWHSNEAVFHVRDIKQSRRYVNYPNYGVYQGLP